MAREHNIKNSEHESRSTFGTGRDKLDMSKERGFRGKAGNPGDESNAAGVQNEEKGEGEHYKFGSGPISDKDIDNGEH